MDWSQGTESKFVEINNICQEADKGALSGLGRPAAESGHLKLDTQQDFESPGPEEAVLAQRQKASRCSRKAVEAKGSKRKGLSNSQASEVRLSALEEDEDYLPPGKHCASSFDVNVALDCAYTMNAQNEES